MSKVKAGRILNLLSVSADINGDINDDRDLELLDKLHVIRSRPNADKVKVLSGSDNYTDYLVTMYDVCFNYHTRLRLSGLWKAFVDLSERRKAKWVTDIPDWEQSLRAPFEYVLRVVLRDESDVPLQVIHAEQSFLYSHVKSSLMYRYGDLETYRRVLAPFAVIPDSWRIDPYFKQLIAKAREELVNQRIKEIEGEMIQMDNPQYGFAW